jgi:UDP-N-acetylglucosamine 2-epimerase (non-hydrolysing)
MKLAPVVRALRGSRLQQSIVHTGQHYDANMSEVFFRQLEIPSPEVNLQVGPGTHAWQTAEIMRRIEPVLVDKRPDFVLVYGDVNSTVATALVCAKLLISVAHVEAGLRSFDRTMPEEINRVLTDHLSELLFTPSEDGNQNLKLEGIGTNKIRFVGNVMIDSLVGLLSKARARVVVEAANTFALVTMHRPSNVGDPYFMKALFTALEELSHTMKVIFPVHPRTHQHLEKFNLHRNGNALRLVEPLSYLDFLALETRASVVITDSGGVQEETTFLGIPCLTMRDNTERPVTIQLGTNKLVGRNPELLLREIGQLQQGRRAPTQVPPLWDGHTAERIARALR